MSTSTYPLRSRKSILIQNENNNIQEKKSTGKNKSNFAKKVHNFKDISNIQNAVVNISAKKSSIPSRITLLNGILSNPTSRSSSPSMSQATQVQIDRSEKEKIDKLIQKSHELEFNKVKFVIGDVEKYYTPVYNWFNVNTNINIESKKNKLRFCCIICGSEKFELLGKPGNLVKHLRTHDASKQWIKVFHQTTRTNKFGLKIDSKTFELVQFFISSNIAIQALEDKHLRKVLTVKLSKYSFKKEVLPGVLKVLHNKILEKLHSAEFVNLITDIWTNGSMADFLGLSAVLIDGSFKKEHILLGMIRMSGSHNAENIAISIQKIVNNFDFNKAKLSSIVTDEGSSLLRLFKQMDANYFIESDDTDENNEDDQDECSDEDNVDQSDSDENCDDDDDGQSQDESDDDDERVDDENETNRSGNYGTLEDREDTRVNNLVNEISQIDSHDKLSFGLYNNSSPIAIEDNYETEYNLEHGSIVTSLELEIGSEKLPRYSCAAHKINIAVRKAIKSSIYVSEFLADLSKFASSIKKSIKLSNMHATKKSKIHRQNFTRWNSTFLMLYSYYKSYSRNVFDENHKCPKEKSEIGYYLQILFPIYILSTNIQSTNANISVLIPSLIVLIHSNLERLEVRDEFQNEFRNYLIEYLKNKFEYELNSKIYLAAAVLNVSTLHEWRDRSFGKNYFKKGIDSLLDVLRLFKQNKSIQSNETIVNERNNRNQTSFDQLMFNDSVKLLSGLSRSRSFQDKGSVNEEIKENELKIEIETYKSFINEIIPNSTSIFWTDNKAKLPNLHLLAIRLLSIPVTSAAIERFFSLSGSISNKNGSNLSDELLIHRSVLKANLDLLKT